MYCLAKTGEEIKILRHADENRKKFWEKVKLEKFSVESEFF